MLVQCPKCKTTYKVSEEVIKGSAPAFRCSRCKHTFELEWQAPPPAEKAPSAGEPGATTADDRELSFVFAPKEKVETFREDQHAFADPTTRDQHAPAGSSDRLDKWSMSGSEAKHEEPFTISERSGPGKEETVVDPANDLPGEEPQFQPTPPPRESGDNILSIDPYRDQQASTLPYLTVFGLLVILFSLVTAFHHVNPKAAEGLVRKIPLVGPSLLKNNQLKNGVLLQSLRAGYQGIQGNREVFVITGVALNQNPVVIREVRVIGQIFNQEGNEIEQQTIWVGNAISPKIVRGMTAQDISDLQRLKPLKTFEIPPGDAVSFAIVFLKSSKGIKDFSCETVSAEGAV